MAKTLAKAWRWISPTLLLPLRVGLYSRNSYNSRNNEHSKTRYQDGSLSAILTLAVLVAFGIAATFGSAISAGQPSLPLRVYGVELSLALFLGLAGLLLLILHCSAGVQQQLLRKKQPWNKDGKCSRKHKRNLTVVRLLDWAGMFILAVGVWAVDILRLSAYASCMDDYRRLHGSELYAEGSAAILLHVARGLYVALLCIAAKAFRRSEVTFVRGIKFCYGFIFILIAQGWMWLESQLNMAHDVFTEYVPIANFQSDTFSVVCSDSQTLNDTYTEIERCFCKDTSLFRTLRATSKYFYPINVEFCLLALEYLIFFFCTSKPDISEAEDSKMEGGDIHDRKSSHVTSGDSEPKNQSVYNSVIKTNPMLQLETRQPSTGDNPPLASANPKAHSCNSFQFADYAMEQIHGNTDCEVCQYHLASLKMLSSQLGMKRSGSQGSMYSIVPSGGSNTHDVSKRASFQLDSVPEVTIKLGSLEREGSGSQVDNGYLPSGETFGPCALIAAAYNYRAGAQPFILSYQRQASLGQLLEESLTSMHTDSPRRYSDPGERLPHSTPQLHKDESQQSQDIITHANDVEDETTTASHVKINVEEQVTNLSLKQDSVHETKTNHIPIQITVSEHKVKAPVEKNEFQCKPKQKQLQQIIENDTNANESVSSSTQTDNTSTEESDPTQVHDLSSSSQPKRKTSNMSRRSKRTSSTNSGQIRIAISRRKLSIAQRLSESATVAQSCPDYSPLCKLSWGLAFIYLIFSGAVTSRLDDSPLGVAAIVYWTFKLLYWAITVGLMWLGFHSSRSLATKLSINHTLPQNWYILTISCSVAVFIDSFLSLFASGPAFSNRTDEYYNPDMLSNSSSPSHLRLKAGYVVANSLMALIETYLQALLLIHAASVCMSNSNRKHESATLNSSAPPTYRTANETRKESKFNLDGKSKPDRQICDEDCSVSNLSSANSSYKLFRQLLLCLVSFNAVFWIVDSFVVLHPGQLTRLQLAFFSPTAYKLVTHLVFPATLLFRLLSATHFLLLYLHSS